MSRALINVPPTAKPGQVIEIRAMIGHVMETGFRPGDDGKLVPRDIINRFVCRLDGEEIFSVELFPAIAANPYFAFTTTATKSGTLEFEWTDDKDRRHLETAKLNVV